MPTWSTGMGPRLRRMVAAKEEMTCKEDLISSHDHAIPNHPTHQIAVGGLAVLHVEWPRGLHGQAEVLEARDLRHETEQEVQATAASRGQEEAAKLQAARQEGVPVAGQVGGEGGGGGERGGVARGGGRGHGGGRPGLCARGGRVERGVEAGAAASGEACGRKREEFSVFFSKGSPPAQLAPCRSVS